MSMIRPSLILRVELPEQLVTDEVKADFNRAYSHMAPTMVQPAQGDEKTIEFVTHTQQAFWKSTDEGADAMWNGMMLQWLENMFYKLSNNMIAVNANRVEDGKDPFVFDWMDMQMGDTLLSIKLDADSGIPDCALDMVKKARALCNGGDLSDAVRIDMPSRASYEQQKAAAEQAAAENVEGDAPAEQPVAFDVAFGTWGITDAAGATREYSA